MSGSARNRGTSHNTRVQPAETASRRGDRLMPPGAFDGPASRGSASQSGPGGRGSVPNASGHGSPASGSGFEPQAPTASSRRLSQYGGSQQAAPQAMNLPAVDPARDPGNAPRLTDRLRNVDLPPSFYNIDAQVSNKLLLVFACISFSPWTLPLSIFELLNPLSA
jgi:hypothetical protein